MSSKDRWERAQEIVPAAIDEFCFAVKRRWLYI